MPLHGCWDCRHCSSEDLICVKTNQVKIKDIFDLKDICVDWVQRKGTITKWVIE